ncbi:MAG: hypothetical protein CL608_27480, partial [Anaerolineaceae bacterium]|nr:hypothetical protein [Anaerolineaceae bacterium]
MAEFIKMPTLGFDMEEGTMGTWLKEVGDPVQKGDVLAEIESDKVTQELTARADGVLLAQLANTGDLIPVGDNLGIIGEEGEDISGMTDGAGSSNGAAAPKAEAEPAAAEAKAEAPAQKAPDAQPTKTGGEPDDEFPGGVKATPVARRVAEEHSVDLTQVDGSGPGGRIRKADVEAYLESGPAAEPAAMDTLETAVPTPPSATEKPLTRMRTAIARRMTESKTTVPHFYVTSEIDMAAALKLRK